MSQFKSYISTLTLIILVLFYFDRRLESINEVISQEQAYHHHHGKQDYHIMDNNQEQEVDYMCMPFITYKVTLCIHPPDVDVYVSRTLAMGVMWEYSLVDRMLSWIRRDPSLGLIDLGANIGKCLLSLYLIARLDNSLLKSREIKLSSLYINNNLLFIETGLTCR